MLDKLDALPVLWAARNPETGALFIDASERYVRHVARNDETVFAINVPSLLRVARAAQWLHDAERNAVATNAAIDAYHAAQVAQELYDARGEFVAALEAANA